MIKTVLRSSQRVSFFISLLAVLSLGVGLLFPSATRADDLPVVSKSGTLEADEEWTAGSVYVVTNTLTVPDGITLTIDAGAIVKINNVWYNAGIQVSDGGTVSVEGTSTSHVVFTSYRDDTFGGDSNANGSSTGAQNDYNTVFGPAGGSTLNVVYADFHDANVAINGGYGVTLSVADSSFADMAGGVSLGGSDTAINTVTLARNSFAVSGSDAVYIDGMSDPTGIAMSGTDANSFTGSGPALNVAIRDTTIPADSRWEIGSGQVLRTAGNVNVNGTLYADTGVVLVNSGSGYSYGINVYSSMHLEEGVIVKSYNTYGINVQSGGAFSASGTNTNPVTFTSYRDDSVGGDTNGDSTSTTPYYNDVSSIISAGNGAIVGLTYSALKYSNQAVSVGGDSNTLAVFDSTFTNDYAGISIGNTSTGSPDYVLMQRNSFAMLGGNPLYYDGADDVTRVVMSGANANTVTSGTGEAAIFTFRNATIPSGTTWDISGATGAVVRTGENLKVEGTLAIAGDATFVQTSGYAWVASMQVSGTVTIAAGATVKSYNTQGMAINDGGTLAVNGTSAHPVNFTSFKDDNIGGDTNGDSTSTTPYYNDAAAVIGANQGGTTTIAHTNFQYSYQPINGGYATDLTVTDSDFSNVYGGIALGGNATTTNTLDFQRNHFAVIGSNPLYVDGISDVTGIAMSGSDTNTFTGSGIPVLVVVRDAVVPTGATWTLSASNGGVVESADNMTVNGTLAVGTGATFVQSSSYAWTLGIHLNGTMTIAHGATIKTTNTSGIEVTPTGTLTVSGTSGDPVNFTSFKDDSIGGDTNGDGTSTSPSKADASAVLYPAGGTLNVAHANFQYANQGIIGFGATTATITDSDFSHLDIGVSLSGDTTHSVTADIERNHFAVETSNPIFVDYTNDITGIVMSGSNKNTFTGSGVPVTVLVRDAVIPTGETWTLDASTGGIVQAGSTLTVNGALHVGTGQIFVSTSSWNWLAGVNVYGTVTLDHGAIVKSSNTEGLAILGGAILYSNGTSGDPVNFTSLKDDSVGGDTNSDSTSTTPGTSDASAHIIPGGGTLFIAHTNFGYAGTAIVGQADTVTVTDSDFSHVGLGIGLDGNGTSYPLVVDLQRNHFATTNSQAMDLRNVADVSAIPLSGSNKNTVTGSGVTATVQIANSTLPSGKTWEISSSSGAIVKAITTFTVDGTLHFDPGTTFVQSGGYSWLTTTNVGASGSVQLDHGVIVKNNSTLGMGFAGGSSLTSSGTSGDPVYVTSLTDDSVGGDTNSDGSTSGTTSAYGGAFQLNGALDADLTYTRIYYAGNPIYTAGATLTLSHVGLFSGGNGIYVDGGDVHATNSTIDGFSDGIDAINGTVTYRGSILNVSSKGVHACDWIGLCVVDATYVDWGTDYGPYPTGGNLVCGKVFADPWVTSSGSSSGLDIFGAGNCGSNPTPVSQLPGKQTNFQAMLDAQDEICGSGSGGIYQDACDAASRRRACNQSAYNTLKANVDISFDLPNYSSGSAIISAVLGKIRTKVIDDATFDGATTLYDTANKSVDIVDQLGDTYDACIGA